MDRALAIHEIVDAILEQSSKDTNVLSRWAQTCRTYSSPALNILWKTMESPIPLFLLLPPFEKSGACWHLRRDVRNDEWARFDEYARRVRNISFDGVGLSSAFYTQLAQSRPATVFFPSLQSVELPADILVTTMMPLLLSPSLRRIEVPSFPIGTLEAANAFFPFLSTIAAEVPALQYLHICQQMSPMSFIQLPLLKNLHTLKLRCNPPFGGPQTFTFHSLISGLAALPHLRVLGLRCWGQNFIGLPNVLGFHRLEVLEMQDNASYVSLFLDRMVTSSLRNVHLVVDHGSVADLCACIAKIRSHSNPSFQVFTCWYIQMEPSQETVYSCLQILTPLLDLRELEKLDLCIEDTLIHHNDDDSFTMASAWPNMKSLSLNIFSDSSDNPTSLPVANTPSLQSIVSFSRLCPKLESLCIAINDDVLPNPSDVPLLSNRLKSLFLHVLNISNVGEMGPQLAGFAHGLFPAMTTFQVQGVSMDEPPQDFSSLVQSLRV